MVSHRISLRLMLRTANRRLLMLHLRLLRRTPSRRHPPHLLLPPLRRRPLPHLPHRLNQWLLLVNKLQLPPIRRRSSQGPIRTANFCQEIQQSWRLPKDSRKPGVKRPRLSCWSCSLSRRRQTPSPFWLWPFYLEAPIRQMVVPQSGHFPFTIGLPFLVRLSAGSFMIFFALHFTQ